jgi:hypothetical protein
MLSFALVIASGIYPCAIANKDSTKDKPRILFIVVDFDGSNYMLE